VLAKTLDRGAMANTPLETPLWIPQSVWLGGWVWFALTSWVLAACLLVAIARGRSDLAEAIGGPRAEGDVADAGPAEGEASR